MKKIVIIVVVAGLAAFAVSLGVRWYRHKNPPTSARTKPTKGKTLAKKSSRSNESILQPADFFAIGSIETAHRVVFDTGDLKRVPMATIGPNTLRGDVRKINGVPVAVFCFSNVYLDRPVRTTGMLPLAIVSKGSIVIKTRMTVSGSPAAAAAGGTGVCGGHSGGSAEADGHGPGGGRGGRGAGGGSYGGRGGDGNKADATSTYGLSPIFRMEGGSGGGGGLAGGGAGGGAIQLAAGKAIEISSAGSILADGGAGTAGKDAAGGGGSGGAILLTAPEITIHGVLSARGGRGGQGGGGGGGGGRIALYFARSFAGNLPSPTRHAAGGQAEQKQWNGQAGTTLPMPALAWWTFDEIRPGARGKVAVDSMGQSHAILWNMDDSALVPGVCGKGLQLDGEVAYVEVYSRDPILGLGRGSMTLALWVRTEVLADNAVLIGKGMPMVEGGQLLAQWVRAGYGKRFVIQKRRGRIVFAVEQGDTRSAVSVTAEEVQTGSWIHLAAVRDAEAKTLRIFVNGRKLAEAPDSTKDVSSHFSLHMGAGEDGAVKNFGRATIDDVRLFAEALGADALAGLIQHAAAGGGRVAAGGPAGSGGPVDEWIDPSLSDKERKALERTRERARRKAEYDRRRAESLRRRKELKEAGRRRN